MTNSFRSYSGSITTKIMLVILIASFALWGVGDMVSRGQANHRLAKVGKEAITLDNYRRELAIESEAVRRQLGPSYSQELLKRLDVPRFVLQRMIQKSLLEQEAQRIGFIPDDTTVALEIRKTPAFIGTSGVFDKARFENALRSQGITERNFVENLRMQLATDKLLDALAIDLPISNPMLTQLQAAFNQGRNVTLYKLAASSPQPAPSDADIAAFHKENAERFTTPELRTVNYVRFTASDTDAASLNLSEQAVESYYNTHEDQFRTPEKRTVEQLLYSSEEKAHEAYEMVKAGKKFTDVANATMPLNKDSLSLGAVDKKSLPENAAETVFRMKAGEYTQPLNSPFGWHIFRVASIEPEGLQPLEKVRPAIEAQLKQDAHENALTDKMNQMEDALGGGSTLKEAATSMGLKMQSAGTFDRAGNDAEGTRQNAVPDLDKFIEVAFKTDEKTESSVITSKGGVYYVLRVESVTPEKLRPLAEVKGEVIKALADYNTGKAAADIASRIDEDLAKKRPAKEIVSAYKLTPTASGSISRDSKSLDGALLLPSLTAQIFAADIGALTSPMRDKDGNYVVALVGGVTPGSANGSDPALRKKELNQSMQEEMMTQYLRHLETMYPVEVHQEIFDQVVQNITDAVR